MKLGDAGLKGGAENYVKCEDLYRAGVVFDIVGATYGQFNGDPRVNFTVRIDGKDKQFSMSVTDYREKFITHFAEDGDEIEGVHLVKIPARNGGNPAWGFDDGEFTPLPAQVESSNTDIPF